jgi:UDP-N-acetylmuramate--alanine ligase
VFQPHRFSRTAQFIDGFADALAGADGLLLAPLYSAGEDPIPGISSAALGQKVRGLRPGLEVHVADSMDDLAALVAQVSQAGDLVLAMGAGDVNSLWDRLAALADSDPRAVAIA